MKSHKLYFWLMNLIFQKEINIRFEVHDPAMVLRYMFFRNHVTSIMSTMTKIIGVKNRL